MMKGKACDQAPAAGKLAAAMATISASRRPIRERVERSNALRRAITLFRAL
jgi:hypothetical protein